LGYDENTKVYVINANVFNAFALPDNSIFVFDKVIKEFESYEELSAILAHEYIHIKERHGMKTLAYKLSIDFVAEILNDGNKSEKFISNSSSLIQLGHSRKFETRADIGGLNLLEERKINLNGMLRMFEKMDGYMRYEKHTSSFLSTHPDIQDRIEYTKKEINKRQNNHVYNQKLDLLFRQLKNLSTL
jgi:beta-barrel assembly-enhancing protease